MATKFRVLLAEGLDEDAEHRLAAGAEVIRPSSGDEKTLCEAIKDCDALVARTHTAVTRKLLSAGKRLRVVGVAGVGPVVDHLVPLRVFFIACYLIGQ